MIKLDLMVKLEIFFFRDKNLFEKTRKRFGTFRLSNAFTCLEIAKA